MLHQRVGERFLANEPTEARATFSNSLARFLVPDIGTYRNELSVVLLVESPHIHEICRGYPLAGSEERSAGLIVRNKLVECSPNLDLPDTPIGSLVYRGCDTVRRLGIMNASQLPFQDSAYINHDDEIRQNQNWNNYIESMRNLKQYYEQHRFESRRTIGCLERAIIEDLRERLECLYRRNPNVLFVRCGYAAQNFYTQACIGTSIAMPNPCDLPHPTNRGRGEERWEDIDCQDARFQGIVGRLWQPQPAQPGA